jgi:uncharacterized protein
MTSDGLEYNQDQESQQSVPPIEIPSGALSEDALKGVIENFIVREGTDYGAVEVHHETKIRQIQSQIAKGEIKIIFDPNTESVTIMTAREWDKTRAKLES